MIILPVLHAIWAVHTRNRKLLFRQKNLIMQPILVPLVILVLTILVMGGELGDAFPVALVNRAETLEGRQFVRAVQESQSNISPYFDVVETEPERADMQVKSGRLLMAITIPEDFAVTQEVYVDTFNINSDATKNTRLRLEHAINHYLHAQDELILVPTLVLEQPEDVWRAAFLGGSSVLFALFFGAILISANLFAFEQENRTRKEIWLTPMHPALAGAGIIITSVIAAVITSLPTLLTAVLLFGFKAHLASLTLVYVAMLPVLVGCAGLGLLLGRFLKRYRTIQPIVIVMSIATFFVGGGFVGGSFLPPVAQQFSTIWVLSRIFEWFNPVLHGFKLGFTPYQYGWLFVSGLLGLGSLVLSYHLTTGREVTNGQ